MKVYRIGKAKYANDLSGKGARRYGGRWNQEGTACLYTSGSRALAVLEYTVNIPIADMPPRLSIITFNIPEDSVHEIFIDDLPGNWKENPAPAAARDFGTRLLTAQQHAIIKIPSVVIADEHNYLLNPALLHPSLIQVIDVQDFIYDAAF